MLSANRPGGWFDQLGKGVALAGQSVPNFWLGILLVLLFSVNLGWLPAFGAGSWKNLVLPAIALGWYPLASLARLTRSAVIEVHNKDHTLFQRAKGVSYANAVQHTMRNASLPIVTLAGIQLGFLMGGPSSSRPCSPGPAWVSWRSRGSTARDYPIVQGVVLVNTCSSSCCCWSSTCPGLLDPRVRRTARGVPAAS